MSDVRRTGDTVWRPSLGHRLSLLVLGLALLVGTAWRGGGGLSLVDTIEYAAAGVVIVTLLPVVLLRWRMVLGDDEVSMTFLRVRRIPVQDVVGAKIVAGAGLTFVLADGSEESFSALGNSAWGHRRQCATRADLAARAVLCAAAEVRGEAPPAAYRLPATTGLKRAAVTGGVWAAVVGLLLG